MTNKIVNRIIISVISGFIFINIILVYLVLIISPIRLKRNSFTYEYGDKISTDVATYVNGNEAVLKNIRLDLSAVNKDVGVYLVYFEYNKEKFPFEIQIVDTRKPKIQLKNVEVTIQLGKSIIAKDLIKKIEDQSETTVYFVDEKTGDKCKEKSYTAEGSYIERILVEDAYGNQSAVYRVKIVVMTNHIKPVIHGAQDVIIQVGEEFDVLNGVTASDDIEGDITSRIQVEGAVNNLIPGDYQVVYTVSDNANNIQKVVRKVTVEEVL